MNVQKTQNMLQQMEAQNKILFGWRDFLVHMDRVLSKEKQSLDTVRRNEEALEERHRPSRKRKRVCGVSTGNLEGK